VTSDESECRASGVGGTAGIDESECLEGRVIVILAGGPSPLNVASEERACEAVEVWSSTNKWVRAAATIPLQLAIATVTVLLPKCSVS
jgi:hypothetical protein